ncbi:MAG TPA: endonuclease/exonuclease/phosphatase family protein [Terracidiphilus sp.]|jgi:endonuclease/exonuclease/phosphatase family metal-dependent hydrolase
MTIPPNRFRIATYNIHKCRGFDMKIVPDRIISVIRELDADILCLQEVANVPGDVALREVPPLIQAFDQAGEIARSLPQYSCAFGANRAFHGGTYGNMTLSRLAIRNWRNHDISRERREPRGVLETELAIDSGLTLHVFNVHLGTGLMERRFQARRLHDGRILTHSEFKGPRLVIGDFNEWTRGLTTRLLRKNFQTFRPRHAASFPRTFPGMLPLLSLDHCYYERPLQLEQTRLWRTRTALIASDHLPLVADFRVLDKAA